jgi:hypothetical protein
LGSEKYWVQKQNIGFRKKILGSETIYWVQKQNTGFRNKILGSETKYWVQKQNIGFRNKNPKRHHFVIRIKNPP